MRRGSPSDVDELHHRVGPHDVAVDGVLIGKHAARQALADDHHLFPALAVAFVEIAARDEGHAQRREESRRDGAEASARILLARPFHMAIGGEFEARAEGAGIAPRHHGAHRHVVHARQFADLAQGLPIEAEHLLGRLAVRHHGHVHRQHLARLQPGLRGLQCQQRLQQHAGAGQQDEGRGDLRDREDALPSGGIARQARAPAGQPAMRAVCRGQARHERQQHRRHQGEAHGHPQHAGIHREIERADAESRGVSRQHREHGARAQNAQRGARAA